MRACHVQVAVLFVCDIDDNLWAYGVSDEVKLRVATGRELWLTRTQQDALLQSGNVSVLVTTLVLPVALSIMGTATSFVGVVTVAALSWATFLPGEVLFMLASDEKKDAKLVGLQIALEVLKCLVIPLVWLGIARHVSANY